jgi:hypothetical protein
VKGLSFDHLNATEFEELCYDLLKEIGFVNVNWRKGTGLAASPADRGRDIECQIRQTEIDGTEFLERWFVECKHYKKGVPPDKLQSGLSWALAQRPDRLCIIASGFLSNAAKDYLEKFKTENKPPFRIKVWEKPNLQILLAGKWILLQKYNLFSELNFLSIVHPAHLQYMLKLQSNSLDYFLEVMDNLEATKREEIFDYTYSVVIPHKFKKPLTGKETLKELMIGQIDYSTFKSRCREIAPIFGESFLVQSIVGHALRYVFHLGDITSIPSSIERCRSDIEDWQDQLNDPAEDQETIQEVIKISQTRLASLDQNTRRYNSLYQYLCDNVVRQLLLEVPNFSGLRDNLMKELNMGPT